VRVEAFSIPATTAASAPSSASPAGEQRLRALVALQGEATRELIGELLSGEGFEVLEASSGTEALARVSETRPALVLVDVGLSDIMGFQVCETIRKDSANAGVKIILVAAIHNKDRYRRQPGNLFGADDFIERHQIETDLVTKVKAFRDGAAPPAATAPSSRGGASGPASRGPERSQPPAQEADLSGSRTVSAAVGKEPAAPPKMPAPAPEISSPPVPPRMAPPVTTSAPAIQTPVSPKPAITKEPSIPPVAPPKAAAPSADDPVQEAARRLARIIVSDIALYNAKKVDEGVLKGTFFDLLRTEIEEGRRLYEERRDPSLQGAVDLFQQTLEQFVATRRELLNRSRPAAA
jgi:CheY-like chemotaxis protein